MTFLHPLALLGLAAAAIPALLHLLERRTPPEAEFPPLRYLSEAERQSARRLRLRHLLLLVLRTALVAAIVLAAARPLVPSPGEAGSAHEPTALVVILDNSPSSGTVVDGRPVLDRLKAVARASIVRASPADRVWLVLADGVARGGSREALLAALDGAAVGSHRLDLVAAVRGAVRMVDAEPLPGHEVHAVSDFQRTALGPGRVDVPHGVRVLTLAPPGAVPPNRGIAAVRIADGAVAVSVAGTPGAGAAPVTVQVGGRVVGRALAAPGADASLPLPPLAPGWWVGEAALDPDELRADDRRLFVWRAAPPARVTVERATGAFVAAALGVLRDAHRAGDGGEVTIAEQAGPGKRVVLPPADPALLGQVDRGLAARGARWRFGAAGTPGPITSPQFPRIGGIQVTRRYRLEGPGGAGVLATVNGEPWVVKDGDAVLVGSRLDTAWTALPAAPGFVPFVDALVNGVARGEAPIVEREGTVRVEFATRGPDTVGATVYGPDPRESDLTPAAPAVLRRVLGALVLDERSFAAERFAGTRRADVSGVLLALALLLAAVELGVATLAR